MRDVCLDRRRDVIYQRDKDFVLFFNEWFVFGKKILTLSRKNDRIGMKRENNINLNNVDDFRRYYVRMFPELKYFTGKYIEDEETVGDMIQDLWLDLWEQKIVFSGESSLKAYLYRTLHNEALNYLRTQMREQARYQAMADWDEGEPDILNRMIEAELYAMLNETFSRLSPVCKKVYIESLKGKSQKEIAESLNISVNTVKKHINNANHYMKEQLEKLLMLIALLH